MSSQHNDGFTQEDLDRMRAHAEARGGIAITTWDVETYRAWLADQKRQGRQHPLFEQYELQAQDLAKDLRQDLPTARDVPLEPIEVAVIGEALMATAARMGTLLAQGADIADVTCIVALTGDRLYEQAQQQASDGEVSGET